MPRKSTKAKREKQTRSSKSQLEKMKMEIANDFGVELGADASARQCGSVGGEMTRRFVKMGQDRTKSSCESSKSKSKKEKK